MRNKYLKIKKDYYLDYNFYLNQKSNYLFFLLKYFIYKSNKDYINKKTNINFNIGNYMLDNNQKEAIFTDEINTLVLAGAGSGKTLTIIGKIKYLIEEKGINEKEILCLSFTNDSVNDLKKKINYNLDIFTFHKLALKIIEDYKINKVIKGNYLGYIIDEIFLSIVSNIDEKMLKYFNNTITSFINLFKNYNYDISYFDSLCKKYKDKKMLELIKKVYLIYQEELESSNSIDFNDMINYACDLINKKGLKRYYKYIIIDEFQDISENRCELIKKIRDSTNSKIFAVGDDYQSIYKFSGSKIDMITNFKKYFGHVKVIKLCNTYRNSYELIRVSTKFIMRNKNQVKKKLNSNKSLYKPIKIIYYKKNMDIKFNKLIEKIDTNILVLGRNNYDLSFVFNVENKDKYNFKTIHKSKGLEEENVIILNLSNNIYGFPNKKKDDLSSLLLPKEKYLYEEERRLFYVALTRTKNYVYLFVDKDNPSIFVKEILRKNKKYIEVLDL